MNEIYFAQIREDAEVERALVARHPSCRLAVVASGGCTALSLLDDTVETVHAIDANPAQAALVELKKAAIHALDRDAYLGFIGERDSEHRLATYAAISADLPAYARSFWDARPSLVAGGVNRAGVTERFYALLGENLRRSVLDEAAWEKLFACEGLEAQRDFRREHCETEAFRMALRVLLSRTTHLAFYPAFMFAQAKEHHFGDFFRERFEVELDTRLVQNNYFLSQLLYGRYLHGVPGGMPHYLSETGYAATKRNLHKLSVIAEPLEVCLPRLQAIDAYFLSNVFDWADAVARERIVEAAYASHAPSALFVYRNMLASPPMPERFAATMEVDARLSRELERIERSMLYRSISCGVMA